MKFDTELCELAFKYGTDKCPQLAHSYTPFYYHLFADKRESVHKLLEIGVGCKEVMLGQPNYLNGASLYMWRDFFPNAQIYGIDIKKDLVFKKKRMQTFLCSQADPVKLTKLIKKIGSDIDIVIDDGSHRPNDIILSCLTLMPLLKKEVVYVIEDTNKPHAERVMKFLTKNYNLHVMRRSKMTSPDDRLIVVTNK